MNEAKHLYTSLNVSEGNWVGWWMYKMKNFDTRDQRSRLESCVFLGSANKCTQVKVSERLLLNNLFNEHAVSRV